MTNVTKILGVLAFTTMFAACGPSEQEFTDVCAARCWHETAHCGFSLPGGDCTSFCRNEWNAAHEISADCEWRTLMWMECRVDAPCDNLSGACVYELLDMAVACD